MSDKVINVHGKRNVITEETIMNTRIWYANNALGCITEAVSGDVRVNDLEQYKEDKLAEIDQWLSADYQVSLAFWQTAYYLQTGCSVSIC